MSKYMYGDLSIENANAIRKAKRKARKAAKKADPFAKTNANLRQIRKEAKTSKKDDYSGGVFPAICIFALFMVPFTGGLSLIYILGHGMFMLGQKKS